MGLKINYHFFQEDYNRFGTLASMAFFIKKIFIKKCSYTNSNKIIFDWEGKLSKLWPHILVPQY